jgi:hypothetical protein
MGISIVPLMVVGYQAELFLPLMHSHWDLSVQERLQMVAAVSNAFPITAMLEWVAVVSLFLWFLVTGVQMFFRKTH